MTGLSFGGAGTWHLAMADPRRWAAIAPICGPGDPSRVDQIANAKTPVWVFQGGRDTVVRPERVLETVTALEAAGHPEVLFTVHEDLGHNVWTRVYEGLGTSTHGSSLTGGSLELIRRKHLSQGLVQRLTLVLADVAGLRGSISSKN